MGLGHNRRATFKRPAKCYLKSVLAIRYKRRIISWEQGYLEEEEVSC